MKILIKVIRYIISSYILLFTMALFFTLTQSFFKNELDLRDLLMLYVLLILIILLGWLIWPSKKNLLKYHKTNNQGMATDGVINDKVSEPKDIVSSSNHQPDDSVKGAIENDGVGKLYFIHEMKGKIKQILETIDIIENTSNVDILVGRYQFFIENIHDLSKYKSDPRFATYLSEGVDFYKTLYYDKTITDTQMKIVVNPEDSQYLEFYSRNIVRCFDKYCSKMKVEMSNLKRETAKKNRIEAIIETSRCCFKELDKIGADSYYLEKIAEKLELFGIKVEMGDKSESHSTFVSSIDLEPILEKVLSTKVGENTNKELKEALSNMQSSVSYSQEIQESTLAISYRDKEDDSISNLRTFIDTYLSIESESNGFYFLTHHAKKLVDSFSEICALQNENPDTYDKTLKHLIKKVRETFKFRLSSELKTILENPNQNCDNIKTICLSQFTNGVNYWDGVLSSYSQKRSYYNRISYLLEQLNDIESQQLNLQDLDVLIMNQRSVYLLMQNS